MGKWLTRLFWLAAATCLLPFILLAFLNDIAADDLQYCMLFRQLGFFRGQGFIYHTWAGRFTTSFLNGSFAATGLLTHFYWLPCLLLFGGTWWAIFFMLKSFYSLLPDKPRKAGPGILAASFVLFILLLYVQADIATGFYWFCSAIVYQSSMILFLLMMTMLARRFARTDGAPGHDALILLLIILIEGCNEMSAVCLVFLLTATILAYWYLQGNVPAYLWIYLGAAMLTGLILGLTSGVLRYRHAMMNSQNSYLAVLAGVGFHFIYTLFSVFKEPLFWLSSLAAFSWGGRLSREGGAVGWLAVFAERKIFLRGLIVVLSMLVLSLATIMTGSGGSLPPRAINNLTGLLTIALLILSVLAGIHKGVRTPAGIRTPPLALTAMLSVLLLTSTNYRDAWQTVLSGYFRHAVIQDRDHQLTLAGERHQHVVVVLSLQDAIEDKIREKFPHGLPATIRMQMLEKSPLIYPYDGTTTQNQEGYCRYYGIDSILVRHH